MKKRSFSKSLRTLMKKALKTEKLKQSMTKMMINRLFLLLKIQKMPLNKLNTNLTTNKQLSFTLAKTESRLNKVTI